MKKVTFTTLGLLVCLAAPALAQSYRTADASDLPADAGAVMKDNSAISKDQSDLAGNRAAKARAKANGDSASQAVDSVKIGANKAALSEKQTEKNTDKNIMKDDEPK
jgi:hypothetical protein